ncbi:MAG: CsbD family protein, partial [Rubrobacteraceae bacterium]
KRKPGKERQVPKKSSQDRNEGAMDKVKGRAKEAGGALTGNKDKKAEGKADQDKGTLKKKKGAAKDLLK